MDRRDFLRLASTLGVGGLGMAALSGCGQTNPGAQLPPRSTQEGPTTPVLDPGGQSPAPRALVAYFSRPGENYHYGGRTWLEIGNTEVIAKMIADLSVCDLHRIEAAEPYSGDYDDTVARNVREQQADARPGIANPLQSIDQYDIILLGSPIWNVRTPMIMETFAAGYDFTGTTVYPFVTYAVSGLCATETDYRRSCQGATIGEGIAIRGEQVMDAEQEVSAWLGRTGLLT